MSWAAVVAMACGAFAFKAFGVMVLGRFANGSTSAFDEVASLIPAALFAAIVVVQTFDSDGTIVIDARLAGVLAGTVAVWRRAPFVVVVVLAMAVAALVRGQTWL